MSQSQDSTTDRLTLLLELYGRGSTCKIMPRAMPGTFTLPNGAIVWIETEGNWRNLDNKYRKQKKMKTNNTLSNLLSSVNLPKWPQMLLSGKSISFKQAMNIILRTDTFFRGWSGNDHKWCEEAYELYGLDFSYDTTNYQERHLKNQAILKKIKYIETEYVHNSWISCSYIGGPHGWCHPDGTLEYHDNIGKWPDATEVYEEFALIAKNFKFLDFGAKLMSGESFEENTHPVIQFHIHEGKVDVIPLDERDVLQDYSPIDASEEFTTAAMVRVFSDAFSEHAIDIAWLRDHARRLGLIKK